MKTQETQFYKNANLKVMDLLGKKYGIGKKTTGNLSKKRGIASRLFVRGSVNILTGFKLTFNSEKYRRNMDSISSESLTQQTKLM